MMGTTMDKESCEWVKGRLPLAIGGVDGPDHPRNGGSGSRGVSDLAALERRAVRRHLSRCPACRAYRDELADAAEVLAIAAAALPLDTDAPSLWPALERRIAGATADPSLSRPGSDLDDDRPLRSAWMHDTLAELADSAWPQRSSRGLALQTARRAAILSLAASVLVAMLVIPMAWRLRAGAVALMTVNAEPVSVPMPESPPDPLGPPLPAIEPAPLVVEDTLALATDAAADPDADDQQLARAESIPVPVPSKAKTDAAVNPRPDASSPSPRFGYDLDRGIPMPPDGRDSRSVY